jgi:hypothetical protein
MWARGNAHVVGELGDPFVGGPVGVRRLLLDSEEPPVPAARDGLISLSPQGNHRIDSHRAPRR